jgi:hypothetical protein
VEEAVVALTADAIVVAADDLVDDDEGDDGDDDVDDASILSPRILLILF